MQVGWARRVERASTITEPPISCTNGVDYKSVSVLIPLEDRGEPLLAEISAYPQLKWSLLSIDTDTHINIHPQDRSTEYQLTSRATRRDRHSSQAPRVSTPAKGTHS